MTMIPSPLPANASPGFAGIVSPEGFQTLHRNSLAREVVRLVTGEITRQIPIVSIPSLGVAFTFFLSNGSQHPLDSGPVGPNWRHNYQTKLDIDTSIISYIAGDGQQVDFVPDGSGGWVVDTSTSTFVTHQLTNPSGTIWELKSQPGGNIWRFDNTPLSGYPETAGRLIEVEDRKGNTVTLNYSSGKLSSVEEPLGREISLSYTGDLLTSITDPESNTHLLTYDGFDNLKTVSGPEGCTVTFGYDGTRLIRSILDARGNETTYKYLGTSIAKVRFPGGHTVKYSYPRGDFAPQEQLTTYTSSLTPFTTTRVIMPGGETTEYRFEPNGNLWRVILPSGNIKRYFWSGKQRFLYCAEGMPRFNTLDLLGHADSIYNRFTKHTVNARGDTVASMEPTGILSTYEYDSEGRLLSIHPGQVNFGVQGNWPENYGSEGYVLCGFESDASDVYQAPTYLSSTLSTAITNGDGMGGNTYLATNDNSVNLMDPRVPVKGPDSLHRGIGFWQQSGEDDPSASFEFTVNLTEAKAFNLSVYSHSADLGKFGGTPDPFKYNAEYGRDIVIQVEDMNGTQSYRVFNNAPGVWVTFPVEGDTENGIKVTVTADGPANRPNDRPVISALAFDPHEDLRFYNEYTDGLLTKTINALGEETSYAYNTDGTLASVTDARGKTRSYTYADTHKNLTAITDHDSNVTALAYDDVGNVTSTTDAKSHTTSMTYDGKNRVLTVTDPLTRVTEYDYDGNGNLLSLTDALDRVTSFTYTANNQLATVEDELGQTIQIFYDENGRRSSIIDARGIETKFFYNEDGNLIRTELPNGEKVTYSIDALNQVVAVTGPNGNQSSADLVNLTGAANFFSNPGIEKADPTWPDGAHDWVNSDGSRTRELTEVASGQASLAIDDEVGVLHDSLALPEGGKYVARAKFKGSGDNLVLTAKVRDSQGTPVATELSIPIGGNYSDWAQTPLLSFEVPGDSHTTPSNLSLAEFSAQLESSESAEGWLDDFELHLLSETTHRDKAGRVKYTTSPIGARVYYERDRLARVVAIEDAKGERVTMSYDALDRVVQIIKPSGEALSFSYNEVGALSSFTDGRSKTTTFAYDNLNRLVTITYHDTSTESFTYDAVGNLLTYTDPTSQSKTFAYDDADRLTSITYSTDSSTVVFTYDDVDNLLTQTERNGDVVTYTYDDIDRLTSVSRVPDTGNTTPAWGYSFTYDANGNRLSSNVSGSAPYGASTTGTANSGGGHQLWRVETEDALYDDNDARYGTSRYSGGYDSMNRPPAYWVGDTRQAAFEYDSESRRTGIDYANGVNSSVSFDIIGRPIGFRTEKDATEILAVDYSYDINSNRTAQVTGNDTFDYHIDEDGRLVGESINRMVTLLPQDLLAGSFEECTEQSGGVELLPLDDAFSGSDFNSDRWKTGHVALSGATTIDPDPYLGGEIRQNDGLHFVFPRGYTDRTNQHDHHHPLVDDYSVHFGKYRLFAEHRKPLVGDFDVQVDFSYLPEKHPSASGIEIYASLNPMSEDGYNDIVGVRRLQYWYQAGSNQTTTDNSGKFRLVRSGSVITAYHWDSGTSSWQTYTGWTYSGYGDPVWIGLSVFTNQNSVVSGSFSNFIFNDGGDTRADAGAYTSSVYDAGRTVTWGNLSWEETLPSGTDIELQMAFSDDEEGPWNYVGPDGTSGTKFTTSSGQSVYGSTSSRYCRYKAYLTGDGTDTPTLGTVELGFSGNLGSQIRTFAFDDAGNITEKITKSDSSLIEETRTYNDLNEITQNQIDDGTTVTTWTFTHDSNGNMTSKSDGTDTYTYVWNEDNQLESVELNSSPVIDYVYDSGSRMLQRTQGSTTTNFHWDGWDLVREEKDDGVVVEVTNYLVPHGEILAFERDDEWFYLHGDGLSSTQLVTDDTGAQAARIVYGAWGEQLSVNDSVPGGLDVRFVGGLGVRNDSASGLIYMRHRWYDAQLGRFISRDPIGFEGGYNLYEYARGNSPKFVDPQGLDVVGSKFFQTAARIGGPPIAQAVRTRNPWVIGGAVVGAAGSIGVYYWYAGGDDDSGEQVPQKTTLIPYGGELLTPEQLIELLKNRPKPNPKPPTPTPPTPPGSGGSCWEQFQAAKGRLNRSGYSGPFKKLAAQELERMYDECETNPGWEPPCDHPFWK